MQTLQPAQGLLLALAQISSYLRVTLVVIIIALAVATISLFIVAIRTRSQSQRPWLEYGNFFVVVCGLVAVIIGFLSILLVLGSFKDVNQALGFLTAFFGAVVGLVGTFFGIKSSADATAGAQKLAAASGGDTTPPQVLRTNPSDQDEDVDPNIRITATFSKDMDLATINPNTFKLLDSSTLTPVPLAARNGVTYDELTKVATLIPRAALGNGRRYGATITSGVKDNAGNALAQDKAWHFTVANGQQGGGAAQQGAGAAQQDADEAQQDAGQERPQGRQRDS
jgi:uncharacterized membrane protein YqhA